MEKCHGPAAGRKGVLSRRAGQPTAVGQWSLGTGSRWVAQGPSGHARSWRRSSGRGSGSGVPATCRVSHPLDVGLSIAVAGLRAGREHFETHISRAVQAAVHAVSCGAYGAEPGSQDRLAHAWYQDAASYPQDGVGNACHSLEEPLGREVGCGARATAGDASRRRVVVWRTLGSARRAEGASVVRGKA